MSRWAEISVIFGVLSKQQEMRQTVTSHRLIILTTWTMFGQTCRGFNPGMHVRFFRISTSFSKSLHHCWVNQTKRKEKGSVEYTLPGSRSNWPLRLTDKWLTDKWQCNATENDDECPHYHQMIHMLVCFLKGLLNCDTRSRFHPEGLTRHPWAKISD